jgi:Holliday junction resolvasome RuvABC endonuclease subunit
VSNSIKVLFVDPSQRNLGLARALVDPATFEISPLPSGLLLTHTDSEAGKKVRKSSDDLRRATELAEVLREGEAWADLIMAEIPSGSQSARACLGAGVCIGLLASLTKPLIQVSPTEAKKVAVGRATATKDEMIDWAYKLYPNLNWLTHGGSKRPGKLTDANEHLADALAIGYAGVMTLEFRAAAAMHNALNHKLSESKSS